ncbi:MAG: hypothetical protein LAN62_17130 [Acidobacteriia bacterium]|nr:hypothetical protein [Terriglobia bacterium]
MRKLRSRAAGVLLVLSLGLFVACNKTGQSTTPATGASDTAAQNTAQPEQPQVRSFTIPQGTELEVRLMDSVGSARNRAGDTFLATLDEPVVVDNWVVLPKGVRVTGRVTAAQPSGHLRSPAELGLTLTSVELGAATYDIATSGYVRRTKSHAKRNAGWIGGAAAGGALLGALIGGGKGAAIGAGVGAGGGTATAYATGKRDILLPSETRLRFRLAQPLTVELTA